MKEKKKVAKSGSKSTNNVSISHTIMVLLLLSSFLIGGIVGTAIGIVASAQNSADGRQNTSDQNNSGQSGDVCSVDTSVTAGVAANKAKHFLDESFLKMRNMSFTINRADNYGDFLYVIEGSINTPSGPRDVNVYITKDGKYLFLAPPYDTNNIIKPPEQAKLTCKDVNNKSNNPKLLVFVMSHCPFGLQMLRAINEFPAELKNYVEVHYILNVTSDNNILSMHGPKEAKDDLIQLCIREEQKDKFWPFVACFMKDGNTKKCLDEVKIDKGKLNSCMSDLNRGIAYAKADEELSNKFNAQGSPTLVLNDQVVDEVGFSRGLNKPMRSAELIKEILCCGFTSAPKACNTKLPEEPAATWFSKTYSTQSKTQGGQC